LRAATDVGLPGGLNGRQVADAARVSRPELKVLFITGYAENAAIGNGVLEAGMGSDHRAVRHGDIRKQNPSVDRSLVAEWKNRRASKKV
jgi:hypothetical protein